MSAQALVTQAWEMEGEAEDFAKEILDDVSRFIAGIRVSGVDVLWAAFQHTGKTRRGLIVPASFQKESGIQGIVGLILKVGPLVATREDIVERYSGNPPKVGEWAILDTRQGIKFILGGGGGKEGRHIRIVEAGMIYALTARPDWII